MTFLDKEVLLSMNSIYIFCNIIPSVLHCGMVLPQQNLSLVVCEQQRRIPACASAQSDQRLGYSVTAKYHI